MPRPVGRGKSCRRGSGRCIKPAGRIVTAAMNPPSRLPAARGAPGHWPAGAPRDGAHERGAERQSLLASVVLDTNAALAQQLRRLRQARGWSQGALGSRASAIKPEISASTVGLIETGGQRCDRLDVIAAFCAALEVPLSQMLLDAGCSDLATALNGVWDGAGEPDTWAERSRIGRKIGLDPAQLDAASQLLWNEDFLAARDRLADVNSVTDRRSAQARRGHATRSMLKAIATS